MLFGALLACLTLCAFAPRAASVRVCSGGDVVLEGSFRPTLSTLLRLKRRYHGDACAYAEARGSAELLGDFEDRLTAYCLAHSLPAQEPCAQFHAGTFTYTPGSPGFTADAPGTLRALLASYPTCLALLQTVRTLPQESVEDLKARTQRIAFFSTDYATSSPGRKHNVEHAAARLDSTCVQGGAVLSFNAIVGPRTVQNGFEAAPIIENGKFAEGVGGGVCQVSTTLYNAALLAGMDVVLVRRHSLLVHYVEPSFDAMVSAASDLKLANATPYPLWIHAYTQGGKVCMALYGAPRYPGCTLHRVSVCKEELPAEYDDVPTPGITRPQISRPARNGLKSEGYLEVWRAGQCVKRTLLRTDTYQPQRGERLVPLPQSAQPPLPADCV